jgi:hypothetical protein
LFVELCHVWHEILHNVGMRQWVDARFFVCLGGNAAQTCQRVDTVNVHCTATANALSAASSECQSGVDLVLDPDQCVQHHRARLVQVECVRLHAGLRRGLIRVPPVGFEGLVLWFLGRCRLLDCRSLRLLDGGIASPESRRGRCVVMSVGWLRGH